MATTTVSLLADRPECVRAVATMRWREWGHLPEPEDFAFWLDTTASEVGADELPVTFVAVDDDGSTVGAVGLAQFDLSSQHDKSPWVVGMVVAPERRSRGIGRRLMSALEDWADRHGFTEAWVATDQAAAFYRSCGWTETGADHDEHGRPVTVLHKRLRRADG